MAKILETIEYVCNNSKSVKIETKNFKNLGKIEKLETITMDTGIEFQSEEHRSNFLLAFSAMNFCFWSDSNNDWSVKIGQVTYSRSTALKESLKQYYQNNPSNFDSINISRISYKDLCEILHGAKNLKQSQLRWTFLNETFAILNSKFNGTVTELLKQGNFDTQSILNIIVNTFPSFNDVGLYKNKEIHFHKRAQALIANLSHYNNIKGIESLTCFADYRLPQVLRSNEILIYDKELDEIIERGEYIPLGSEVEIEIRASTIKAVELIKNETTTKNLNSYEIDNYLWGLSQLKNKKLQPHHRTESFYY